MLTDQFKKNLLSAGVTENSTGEKILLGVSGGMDSMVMLDLFLQTGIPVGVAHCNFGLRGDDSDRDELFVQCQAQERGLEFFSVRFDTKDEATRTGESIQMAARRLRYDWFLRLCTKFGYEKLAIAHNADDTIETFFINLIRGTGIKGLTGIPQTNRHLIRPLLSISRREIEAYARARGIRYREDVTNTETKYIRNKIRHDILPLMREISASFGDTMLENIGRLSQVQNFAADRIAQIRSVIVSENESKAEILIDRLRDYSSFEYVMYEIMKDWGFNNEVIRDLCVCIDKCFVGRRFLSPTHVALLDRGTVVVVKREEGGCPHEAVQLTSASDTVTAYGKRITAQMLYPYQIETFKTPADTALFDFEQVDFPLDVRLWQPGDHFYPLGMKGRKKVSDYLVDVKVSRLDKEQQLVVTNNCGDIVWLVGHRIDERFKISLLTNRILRLTVTGADQE